MPTVALRAGEILRDFVHVHVPVIDLDEKLQRALKPGVEAPHARCLNNDAIVDITQTRVFQPRHQKSSAEGIRLYAILPPA